MRICNKVLSHCGLFFVQAQRRTIGAGLGASGSTVQLEPGDTYKDAVKKTMMARFQEMNS